MPGQTLIGELTCWEPDQLLLNCCADDPNEPPEGDDFDCRMREENDTPRWFDTRKDVPDFDEERVAVDDDGSDHLAPDVTLVMADDAAEEAESEPVTDYPDHTVGMLKDCDPDDDIQAGSRTRLPLGRGVRYRRSVVSRS